MGEKKVEKVKKPLPKKPWLNKTKKKPAPSVESEPVPPVESEQVHDEDVIPVPTKGYNLDFLDKLDDPNFNPFETKTAVKNQFDATESIPVQEEVGENKENILNTTSTTEVKKSEEDAKTVPEEKKVEKVKKPLPKKPWLKAKKKPPQPVEAEESEDVIPVPSKGYNLDFLDKLDDPNFNPFETKTAVVNKFEENAPVIESAADENGHNSNAITESNKSIEQKDDKKEKVEEEKKENTAEEKKPKKALPPKPWLKKGPKKKAPEETPEEEKEDEIVVPSKGYNFDILDKLDDPNFNPFETKSSIENNFEATKVEPEIPVTSQVENTKSINEEDLKPQEELEDSKISEDTSQPSEDAIPVPSKNYNLDFLEKMDDPNF